MLLRRALAAHTASAAARSVGAPARCAPLRHLSTQEPPPPPPPPPPFDASRAMMVATGVTLVALVGTLGGVLWNALALKRERVAVQAQPLVPGNPLVFLDVADGERRVGRLVVQLRRDAAPALADNFAALACAPLGYGYRNSALHGLEKGSRVFGGDFFGSGLSGAAAGGAMLPDEPRAAGAELRHVGPGTVAMTTAGPGTVNSQFYVTLRSTPLFDGVHPVVGYVINDAGFELLAYLDKCAGANNRFRLQHDFRVAACGLLKADAFDPRDSTGDLPAVGLAGMQLGRQG